MGTLYSITMGTLVGLPALIVILTIAFGLLGVVLVMVISGLKAVKEHKDEKEDQAEDDFFALYGVTGEELRLNSKIAEKKEKLKDNRRLREELLEEQHKVVIVKEPVPVPEEPAIVEEPAPVEEEIPETVEEPEVPETVEEAPVEEPAPEPIIEEVEEEPIPEPEPEPEIEPAPEEETFEPTEPIEEKPAPENVAQNIESNDGPKEAIPESEDRPVEESGEKKAEIPRTPKKKPKKGKDDWSNYEGNFNGVYYDPEDACYYEGEAPKELAEKLEAKQRELDEQNKREKKEAIIRHVAPPFLALKTPKNARQTPAPVAGFDESIIYGKYVIEHVDKEDGTGEYFYTLYNPNGKAIYESSNYSALEYCKTAIARFRSHVLIGEFTINAENMKFFFELKRKTYVHKGPERNSFEQANALITEVKNYAQTNIVREQ